MKNMLTTVYTNNYSSNFQKIINTNIIWKLLLFVILFGSSQCILLAQNNTSKVPIGALEINIKTEDRDKIVYITGQVHLSMKTDTSKTYNYDSFKSLTFDINDGLSICQEDQVLFNNVFGHHYVTDLICIEKTKNYYRVLVNNSGLSYWLSKSDFLKFIDIQTYFKGYTISLKPKQNIFTKPNINSPTIPYTTNEDRVMFSLVQVKGDWMEIKSYEEENAQQSSKLKSGWIKWFINNKMTIDLLDND
jgi:hypothetical protein